MKSGTVARNTCSKIQHRTVEPGEEIVYGRQRSVWDAIKATRDEF